VSDDRIPLDGDRAMAFTDAFEKRRDYISAELIHHYNDGEDRVPLPGCPECATPAEQTAWSVYDEDIDIDVDPCGHRFRVLRPVVRTTVREGRVVTEEEWLP
jgi:hypothetical protein